MGIREQTGRKVMAETALRKPASPGLRDESVVLAEVDGKQWKVRTQPQAKVRAPADTQPARALGLSAPAAPGWHLSRLVSAGPHTSR